MKSFKQYLLEQYKPHLKDEYEIADHVSDRDTVKEDLEESRYLEKVHKNPSPDTLKNIAKHSKFQTARFVITHEGHMYAGNADHFLHADLGEHGNGHENHSRNISTHHTIGFVEHEHDGNFTHSAWIKGTSLQQKSDHPALDKLSKAGMIRGH